MQIFKLVLYILVLITVLVGFSVYAQTNKVLSLDGVGDYVEIARINLTNTFTIEAWVYSMNYQNLTILSKMNATDVESRHLHLSIRNGKPRFDLGNDVLVAKTELKVGCWNHITFQYDGTTKKIYIDGVVDNSRNSPNHEENIGNECIILPHEDSWVGLIDEIRIWNTARTQKQIKSTMNSKLNGDEDNLVAYWNFDDGTANDFASNYDGELHSDAKFLDNYHILFRQQRYQSSGDRLKNLFSKGYFLTTFEGGQAIISEDDNNNKSVGIYSLNLGYHATANLSLVGSFEQLS